MHRNLVAALALTAAATAVAAAGCGGDGDGAGSSSPVGGGTPTKAQYIRAADAICADVARRTKAYADQVDALPDGAGPDRLAPILRSGLAETRKGVRRLRSLKVPGEDRATIGSYFASLEKSVVAYGDLQKAIGAQDEAKARRIAADADPLFDEQRRLAQAYGFKRCRSV